MKLYGLVAGDFGDSKLRNQSGFKRGTRGLRRFNLTLEPQMVTLELACGLHCLPGSGITQFRSSSIACHCMFTLWWGRTGHSGVNPLGQDIEFEEINYRRYRIMSNRRLRQSNM